MPLRPKLIKLAKLHLWWCPMERNQIPWIAFDTKSIVTQVDPKSLPPTSAAAKFHSRRVFLQVNQWKDPKCDLLAEEWGWVRKDTGLHPVLMDMTPAPAELLKIIWCNCTADCATARCTCKKHGMKCSMACGHWQGSSCSNANTFVEDEDNSDSEEDYL